MRENLFLVIIIVIVHLLISALLLWIFYRVGRKGLSYLKNPLGETYYNHLNLFISLGIVLLFSRKIAYDTIYKIGDFFISPLEKLNILKSTILDASNHSGKISDLIFDWIRSIYESFREYILTIDYVSLFIFFTFWLLISLFIREIERSVKETMTTVGTGNSLALSSNPTLNNISMVLILLFSIYLCVSSIIAVPEFQTREIAQTETSLASNFPKELDSLMISKRGSLIIHADTSSLKSAVKPIDNVYYHLINIINDYNRLVDFNWSRDEKTKKIAITKLRNAIDSKITHNEGIEYKQKLTDWYLSYHTSWTYDMGFFQGELLSLSDKIKRFAQDKSNFQVDTTSSLKEKHSSISNLTEYAATKLNTYDSNLWDFATKVNLINYKAGPIPDKPQIGEKFGIFNKISGWLLKTESLSLSLIVGLFGFGLLGSICSTFIRKRIISISDAESDILVLSDLKGMLINGLSAAIVVFLAVKGMIVVFSSGDNKLNPYVLFFICLIASVFSEDVWSWARNKLDESLGSRGGKDKVNDDSKKDT
jgi:hypothetical protein